MAYTFTGDEIVSDILLVLPESRDVLASHGLACVNCALSEHESLRSGMSMHGFGEKKLQEILADLNFLSEEYLLPDILETSPPQGAASEKKLIGTPQAQQRLHEMQKQDQAEGYGLKIEVLQDEAEEISFFLDFLPKKPVEDLQFSLGEGLLAFVDPESAVYLRECVLDYDDDSEMFTITPQNGASS